MAVNPVNARINVMVAGQQLLNNLASTYRTVANAAGQATAQVRNWNMQQQAMSRQSIGFMQGLNRVTQAMSQHNLQMQQGQRHATAFGGSILNLTKSMILFSVLLPLVRLPQTAVQSVQDFVKVGSEWEHQIRSINTLLNLQNDEYREFDLRVRNLATSYALTTDEVGTAGKAIASTLGVIQRNTEGMTAQQKAVDDMNTSMILMDKIARLSRASFEEMGTVQEASFTILAAGRLTLDQVDDAFNVLFNTVKIGRSTFQQFNSDAAKFLPMATQWIEAVGTGSDKTAERFDRLTQVMDAFAAASQGVGSERAATGLGRIFQATAGASQQQQKLISQIESFRKTQGLGSEYDIRPGSLYATNSQDMFNRLENVLGPQSPIITRAIERMRRQGTLVDESAQRSAFAQQLQMRYFEQREAVRAFTEITAPGRLAQVGRDRAAAGSQPVEDAYQQWLSDPKSAAQRMSSAWQMVKVNVFDSMRDSIIRVSFGLFTVFDNINKGLQQGIGGQGFFGRVRYIADELVKAFTNYYNSGGKQEIQNLGYTLGSNITQFLTEFFQGAAGKNAITDAAISFSQAFAQGVQDNLPALLGEAIKSAAIQAIAFYAISRGAGLPRALAIPAAAAATAGTQGAAGPIGQLGGLGLMGLLGIVAARSAATRIAGSQFGQTVGPLLGPAARAIGGFLGPIGSGIAGSGLGRAILSTRGIANAPLMRLLGAFARSPVGAVARRVPWIGAGVTAIDALMQAQNPDERGAWSGVGGAIGAGAGAIGGGALGGLLGGFGAIPGAILGGIGGQALGGWAGGSLYDLMHPNAWQAAGAGGAPGTEEQMNLADTFAMGINASDMIPILEQVNRKLDGPGGVASVVRSKAGGPGGGATPGGAVGAGVSMDKAFTSQFGAPLSKGQADAACGPAAVAFFSKVYGRNPTLMEAYNLVSQAQGLDVAAAGGTRNVGVLSQVLTGMGIGNESYQGANIDWGRLAENAEKGIPGIVNIGPSGNFPGHFFQIGGYNRANNTFDIGINGIKGQPRWMTPQQMMALGPAFGAVYGTAAPAAATAAAGGNAPVAAGTGAGPHADFYNQIIPLAKELEAQTGIPWQVTTAIAANETGYGTSNLAKNYNNFFGMQGPGAGTGGDRWAKYGSASQSVAAFGKLISGGGRYATAYASRGDPNKMVQEMKNAGYIVDEPGFPAQAWVNQVQGIMKNITSSGAGGFPEGGGGVTINGPLIATVNLGGAATQEDADNLAGMLANALQDVMNAHGGGVIGQNRLVSP